MALSSKQASLFVPSFEIERRLRCLQEHFSQDGFDAGLLFQNLDRFYYSGTMQPGLLFLPAQEEPLLLIRKNIERAAEESAAASSGSLQYLTHPLVKRTKNPQDLGYDPVG